MVRTRKLLAVLVSLLLLLAACGDGGGETPDDGATPTPGDGATEPAADGPRVGMVYDIGGRGDLSFNDSAAAGLDRAIAEFGVQARELEPAEGGENREELLRLLSQEQYELIFGVGFLFTDSITAASADFADVNYGLIDGFIEGLDESSNVVCLGFAEHEGSFLVGAAAALKSEAGKIGFIGGVEIDLIKKFEAGFVAGAREINPDIEIDIRYISQPPDFSGFADPARGKEVALGMYQAGADVVYHAAGGSGAGLFEAAKETSEGGDTKVWAIGVDSDQYEAAPEEVREYILTSMLKKVDVAVYETIADYVDGSFAGGYRTFDLASDGVGYATSGGFVDDIADQLDELRQRIIDGDITVPEA
jgi:basic membrane protein A and related proteins